MYNEGFTNWDEIAAGIDYNSMLNPPVNNPGEPAAGSLYRREEGDTVNLLFSNGWHTIHDLPERYPELHEFLSNPENEGYMHSSGRLRYIDVGYTSGTGAISYNLEHTRALAEPYRLDQAATASEIPESQPADPNAIAERLAQLAGQRRSTTPVLPSAPSVGYEPGPSQPATPGGQLRSSIATPPAQQDRAAEPTPVRRSQRRAAAQALRNMPRGSSGR